MVREDLPEEVTYKLEQNGKETLKNCKAEDEIYEGPVKASGETVWYALETARR